MSYSDTWLKSAVQEVDRFDLETVLHHILESFHNYC